MSARVDGRVTKKQQLFVEIDGVSLWPGDNLRVFLNPGIGSQHMPETVELYISVSDDGEIEVGYPRSMLEKTDDGYLRSREDA